VALLPSRGFSQRPCSIEMEASAQPTKLNARRIRACIRLLFRPRCLLRLVFAFGLLAILCCGYLYAHDSDRFRRALAVTYDDFGGSLQIAALVAPFLILILRTWSRKAWVEVGRLIRKSLLTDALAGYSAFWFIVFIVRYIWLPERTFTLEEVAEYGQHSVASVDAGGDSGGVSGFWADTNVLVFSVISASLTNNALKVGALMPSLPDGKHLTIASGGTYGVGKMFCWDPNTEIAIIGSAVSPYARRLHMFADAQDAKTGKIIERVTEQFVVPNLQLAVPKVGREIVLCAVETRPGEGATRMSKYGRVTRVGLNMKSTLNNLRVFTDIVHASSFVGAPVFDLRKEVIGVVSSESEETCVLIPAKYLADLKSTIQLVRSPPIELAPPITRP